jgi:glycosyltransferase involved in cell wall biosynthesis
MISPFPKISIVTCLYNTDIDIWRKTLDGIKKQKYPKNRIEHFVMDGGSTNKSPQLARSYGCKVIVRKDLRDKALVRMRAGILKAKGDLILFLEPDNIITESDWFRKMVKPFTEDKNIVGAYSMYNTYEKEMPMVTKYSALIGINDPFVYYLGKSEKMPMSENKYKIGEIINEKKDYYTVRFKTSNLPVLGDNGHMVRRELIIPEAKNMKQFYHSDAFFNLLINGHDTYGVVKNTIIHFTGSNLIAFFKRRILYKSQFYDNNASIRTYFVFNKHSKKDLWNTAKFIFFSLTLFQTIYFSIKGFLKIKEPAWFLHPVACLLAVFFYTRSELQKRS